MEISGQLHSSANFTSGKGSPVLLNRRLRGHYSRARVGDEHKNVCTCRESKFGHQFLNGLIQFLTHLRISKMIVNDKGSIPGREMNFSHRHRVQTGSGPTQPPIQTVLVHPTGRKWPERKAGHPPLFSTDFKNAWSFTFIPHTCSRRDH
jgi:hypothetical protein